MIKLVIADDEYIIRQGLASIDWANWGILVTGLGTNGLDTLEIVRQTKPHILLSDIRMPGMDGIELTQIIRAEMPAVRIILLTGHSEFDYAYAALQLEVVGFVIKPASPEDIIAAVLKAKTNVEIAMKYENELTSESLSNPIIEEMLAVGNRPVPDDLKSTHHEAVAKCLTYLENNYMNNISLGQIASYVHLSPVYLSRLLKKDTGQTFLDILTQIRIAKSMELLKDQSIKSYEAASRVGFVDSKYFAQLFRKYYGMTPTEFRTNINRRKQHPDPNA